MREPCCAFTSTKIGSDVSVQTGELGQVSHLTLQRQRVLRAYEHKAAQLGNALLHVLLHGNWKEKGASQTSKLAGPIHRWEIAVL